MALFVVAAVTVYTSSRRASGVGVRILACEHSSGQLLVTTVVTNASTKTVRYAGNVPISLLKWESKTGSHIAPLRQLLVGPGGGILGGRSSVTNTFSVSSDATRLMVSCTVSRPGLRSLLARLGLANVVPTALVPEPKQITVWSNEIDIPSSK